MIDYLMAFLIGGAICAVAQILVDTLKLLPIYIIVLFVSIGSFLEIFGIYDKLIALGRAGAMIPISSFGHSLTHAAVEKAMEKGFFGLFLGIFDLTAPGITAAILFAFIMSLIFKPRG
jgi:stage V sporulation protein AE